MKLNFHSILASLLAATFLSLPLSLKAGTFSDKGMQLNGSATLEDAGNTLRLTPALNGQAGSAFISVPAILNPNTDFSTWFAFRIHSGSGADGMTFTIQNDTGEAGELGGAGGSLGYSGISPSVAVEFDTWVNNDPNDNHLGININGSLTSVATSTPASDLDDGATNYAWVDYDSSSGLLEVYFDDVNTKPGAPVMSETVDLYGMLGSQAFIGFTAATGAVNNIHDVEDWTLFWSSGFVEATPVPSLSDMAAILLILLLAGTSAVYIVRKRHVVSS